MTSKVPTEAEEQKIFVHYLVLNNIKHFRVPNETYTTSWKQKMNNKLLGVSRGVPDIFIIIKDNLVAIEMKRLKGSVTSPEQKVWIERLNKAGVYSKICFGAKEAIALVEELNR